MKETSVTTGLVKLSYPALFRARTSEMNPDQGARFSTDILIPKTDTDTMNRVNAAIEAAKKEGMDKLWGGKDPGNKMRSPIKDGDEKDNPEYKGCWVLSPWAKEQYRPNIIDKDFNKILDETEIYGGVVVRASVNFYAYDYKGQKGINCGFDAGIQKIADADPFGGGHTSAEEAFGAPSAPVTPAIDPITGQPR